jgi:hypothetical protein
LVFDLNDFDETHPGPFEWDVKRLAASLEIAGGDNGYSGKQRRSVVLSAVNSYRRAIREFAGQSNLVVGTPIRRCSQDCGGWSTSVRQQAAAGRTCSRLVD